MHILHCLEVNERMMWCGSLTCILRDLFKVGRGPPSAGRFGLAWEVAYDWFGINEVVGGWLIDACITFNYVLFILLMLPMLNVLTIFDTFLLDWTLPVFYL